MHNLETLKIPQSLSLLVSKNYSCFLSISSLVSNLINTYKLHFNTINNSVIFSYFSTLNIPNCMFLLSFKVLILFDQFLIIPRFQGF